MKTICAVAVVLAEFAAGCVNVQVPVVEPWEGRYSSMQEFREKTEGVELKNGQSIWVLTNGTMYRILKKAEK